MKEFKFSSGTCVFVGEKTLEINRSDGKSAAKSLFAGRASGLLTIKLNSITGVQAYADYLIIYGSGLPAPSDFKVSSIAEIKQYPNCIVAKGAELKNLYDHLIEIL
ncbi:hypothetical protein GH811_18360 [Acetobacterium malicum]|jgi:hypothetical protein|uniref:Uncharacterized protein n=1 Tax=Acetobacterium malicum TaxID=52692 RepID=A0ABR6Z2Z9_9FIRM|nr:hypothetical protein [Acetobacterium malicum]MBC3901566.1 hypothetical protein [Acetobacterium malicum]